MFVDVAQRQHGEAVLRIEEKRKPEIDQRRRFVALPAADGTEPEQHFGGPLFRCFHQRFERLATAQIGQRRDDDRMVWQTLVEGLIGADRLHLIAMTRHEARIGINEAQSVLVGFIGDLEALRRFRRVIGDIGNQGSMIVAKNREILLTKPIGEFVGLFSSRRRLHNTKQTEGSRSGRAAGRCRHC